MQPLTFLAPVCFAVFLWWFTTGLIIAVYGRSPRLIHLCFAGSTGAMVLGVWGLVVTRPFTQPRDVYLAFTCGLVIWGWQTASYYLGYVKGPRSNLEEKDEANLLSQSMAYRFRLAFRTGLYHELLVVAFALLLTALTWSYANRWGLWIFLAMWIMHSSAKLNVFLGVRNFRTVLLPSHLHHLDKLLNKQPNNAFFPFSVVIATSVTLAFFYKGVVPGTPPSETVGFLLLATMIALGVLEHLMLVLPIPVTLYGWGLRALPPTAVSDSAHTRQKKASLQALPNQMIDG